MTKSHQIKFSSLPQEWQRQFRKLRSLYRQVDRDSARFQVATGLHCPKRCGHCCKHPQVEATVFEMKLLAYTLLQQGEADNWLARCREADYLGPCIFYQSLAGRSDHGQCSVYPYRPLLCRLFGFSMNLDKKGKAVLVTCKKIKKNFPAQIRRLAANFNTDHARPSMADYSRKLFSIDPIGGREQVPINMATARAIEKVGLFVEQHQRQ